MDRWLNTLASIWPDTKLCSYFALIIHLAHQVSTKHFHNFSDGQSQMSFLTHGATCIVILWGHLNTKMHSLLENSAGMKI